MPQGPIFRCGIALLGFALVVFFASTIAEAAAPPEAAADSSRACCSSVEPSDEPLGDESIYHLDVEWTSEIERTVELADFRGKPVVLSMIFTHCGYACPMTVHDMKQIGNALPEELREDVQYVLVSLDPDRDTPEVLHNFARAHRLDADQWTLLHGEAFNVRMLAALLGVRYKKQSDGQFAHSNLITILNAEGEVVHRQEGLRVDPQPSAEVLAGLLK